MEFKLHASFGTFRKAGLNAFGGTYDLQKKFDHTKYKMFVDLFDESKNSKVNEKIYDHLLHQPLTTNEIKMVSNLFGNNIFNHIDHFSRKEKLR